MLTEKKSKRRTAFLLLSLLFLFCLTALPVFAQNTQNTTAETSAQEDENALSSALTIPVEYEEFLNAIPEDIREILPDGIFSMEMDELSIAVDESLRFENILQYLWKRIKAAAGEKIGMLTRLLGLVFLSAAVNAGAKNLAIPETARAFHFCARLCLLSGVLGVGLGTLHEVTNCITALHVSMGALLPVLGVLYAMGGNITQAVVMNKGLTVFLSFLELVVGSTVLPLFGSCFALSLCEAVGNNRLAAIGGCIKKTYMTALSFLMAVLAAVLAAQHALSGRADSFAMRSARFAVGNGIPVVGHTLADMLRTLAAGVEYLRAVLGWSAILVLAAMMLPAILSVSMTRIACQVAAGVAGMLGCEVEGKFLGECAGLYGTLLGILCLCGALFLLVLVLFVKCAAACA